MPTRAADRSSADGSGSGDNGPIDVYKRQRVTPLTTVAPRRACPPVATVHRVDLARGRGPWLLAWLAVVPIVALRAGTLAESDTFWQTRTGELILDLGRLPTADPFSWTAAGHPWTVNSWGCLLYTSRCV